MDLHSSLILAQSRLVNKVNDKHEKIANKLQA